MLMNGIYSAWGYMIYFGADASKRDNMKKYIDNVETYLEIVTISESIVVPLKVIFVILVRNSCCSEMISESASDVHGDGFDAESPKKYHYNRPAYTITTRSFQRGATSTYQIDESVK